MALQCCSGYVAQGSPLSAASIAAHRRSGSCSDRQRAASGAGRPDQPIPYSPTLEDAFFPDADAIAASVARRLNGGGS